MPTHETVENTITRWCATDSVCDRPRSGPSKKVPEAHYRYIDDAMAQDDELTASSLKNILEKRFSAESVKYSTRTIARIRNVLGWTFSTTRYCQAIRDANKQKRLAWCTECMDKKELFNNVIFMFSGIMTATRYGDILSASLVPFIKKYPDGHRLFKITTRSIQANISKVT